MTKRAFLIILLVLLLALGGAGWYIYTEFFAPQTPDTGEPTGTTKSFFSGFGIFGGGTGTVRPTNTQTPGSDFPISSSTPVTEFPRLRQLTTTPTAGAMASTTSTTTIVRYIDRGVGHTYEQSLNRTSPEKLTNTTISRIYEALWNRQGTSLITRYLRDDTPTITNFYADIIPPKKLAVATSSTSTTTTTVVSDQVGELSGKYLPSTILSITVSPKGDQIFILSDEGSNVVGYISKFNGEGRSQVFSSPFKSWIVDWNNDSNINLTTKATYVGSGFMYSIDVKKNTIKKILGPYRALTTKSSYDNKYILFTENRNGQIMTSLYNTVTKSIQEMTFRTFPEKCAWSRRNPSTVFCAVPVNSDIATLPDPWYQGTTSFTDNIWEYDAETGELRQFAKLLDETTKIIDAVNPFFDTTENYLFFTNKRDLTLWSLDVRVSASSR